MSRKPSPETELRTVRAELKSTQALLREARGQWNLYRERASKAEAEVAGWKLRFDALLRILPSKDAK